MQILIRRKSHDAEENRDSSPTSSAMKHRKNNRNRASSQDEISAADTAELSAADSIERNNNSDSLFPRRKSTEKDDAHDATTKKRYSSLADESGKDNCNRRRNKSLHRRNSSESDVQFLDLKAPAPTEPSTQYTKEEYEEMLQEYEDEIVRLEKLNATLSANVSALYAENAAVEEEHHQFSESSASLVKGVSKQTSMEISVDEEYAPPDNDMILTEDQYLHEITKLQKSNIKFRKQFETQKKLVAKLSLHLKTSADKITALNKEKDEWKTKFENKGKSNGASLNNTIPQDDQNEVHKYQIQVIQNELIALQNLMSKNSKARGRAERSGSSSKTPVWR
jgi:hypothetical protein